MAQERRTRMNIVLLGDSGAGKTSIRKALTEEKFKEKGKSTFNRSYGMLNTKVSHEGVETLIEQTIWDTPAYPANQKVNAFIFVVDGTKSLPDSDSEIVKQLAQAKKSFPDAKFYIAVNKYDAHDKSGSQPDEGALKELKDSLKLFVSGVAKNGITVLNDDIVFCSAKTGQNIGSLFDKVTGDFCKKLGEGPYQILETRNAAVPVTEPPSSPLKNALDWVKGKADQLTGSKTWTKGSYLLELGAATLTDLARNVTNGVLKAINGVLAAGETVVQTVSEIYNNLVKEKPAQRSSEDADGPPKRVSFANPDYKSPSAPQSTQSNLDSTPGKKLENENKESTPPSNTPTL